jgi:hypothetical protein
MLISGNKDSLLRFIKNTDSVTDLGGGKGDRWVSVLSKFPNLNLTFSEPDKSELEITKTKIKGKNVLFFDSTNGIKNLIVLMVLKTRAKTSFIVLRFWNMYGTNKCFSVKLQES